VLAETYRLFLYGVAATSKLQIDEALGLYAEARALAEKYLGPKSVCATIVTGLSALLRYERGDVNAAEIAVLDDIEIIEATTVLVRAALIRDDIERALMLLNRAERLASERGWGRVVAAFLLERVRLLLREQRTQDALAAADRLQKIKDKHPAPEHCSWSDIHVVSAIAEGLLTLDAGRADASIKLFTWAYEELLAVGNRHGALRVGLELSNAHFLPETNSGPSRC
jgi:tetratricopeptide (TPR) repeat protein